MIPGVAEAIAKANAREIPVIVVTNQAGIARGYYGWEDFAKVQSAIVAALAAAGASLDVVLACGYHGVGAGPLAVADHAWRKPNCGMLDYAAERHGIDLGRSWIVGDKVSDLEAGLKAGLAGGFLVKTGHGEAEARSMPLLRRRFWTARLLPPYATTPASLLANFCTIIDLDRNSELLRHAMLRCESANGEQSGVVSSCAPEVRSGSIGLRRCP